MPALSLGIDCLKENPTKSRIESNHAMVISMRRINNGGFINEGSTKLQIDTNQSIDPRNLDQIFTQEDEETWYQTRELERRVEERTQQLKFEHQRAETLLRITTELSSSLDYEQILQRTLEVQALWSDLYAQGSSSRNSNRTRSYMPELELLSAKASGYCFVLCD